MRNLMIVLWTAVAIVIFMGCGKEEPKGEAKRRQAKLAVHDLHDAAIHLGILEPKSQILIKSEVSGTVTRLEVSEGQFLKKGTPILVIDPRPLENTREKLMLQRKKAQLEYNIQKRDYEKDSALSAEGAVSTRQLMDKKDQLSLKAIQLDDIDIDIKDVNEKLEKTLLTAPINGTILNLNTKVGEIVVSATTGYSEGTVIGTIANTDSMQVTCQINEVDYHSIKPETEVNIFLETDPSARAKGKISFISRAAKVQEGKTVRTFEVRVDALNSHPKLIPGINVTVEFIIVDRKKVPALPSDFILNRDGKEGKESVVFVQGQGGKVEERVIKTGATDFKFTEVLSGLETAETVLEPPAEESQD